MIRATPDGPVSSLLTYRLPAHHLPVCCHNLLILQLYFRSPDLKKYDGPGPLVITMDKNGALELKWDNGRYVGIGQVVGNSLAVASTAEGRAVIMLMEPKPDGSLEGKYWRRTDAGTKGTEVWKKK
jgi:hypothetical protein